MLLKNDDEDKRKIRQERFIGVKEDFRIVRKGKKSKEAEKKDKSTEERKESPR